MGLSAYALAVVGVLSAGGTAASQAANVVPLRDVVAHMEQRYEGQVVAIAFDDAGDKAAHYHVDLYYPLAGTAKLDVDADTLAIAARERPRQGDGWTMSLASAAAYAAVLLEGQVLAGELDAVDGADPHYDIDVRLSHGPVARVRVDPTTRAVSWRTPPVVAD